MIFAHGFGCDQNMWRYVAPAFEADHRVVLFDHLGAGASDSSAYDPARYDRLDAYAEDVLEICRALELTDATFVGHSVSSMIGALAAERGPERIGRLVMVGPSPRYIDDESYRGGFTRADIEELLESLDSNFLGWSSAMAPAIMGNPERPELGAELTESFCRTDPAIAAQFARVTFMSDNRADLARVRVPTLVLQCSDDVIAPPEVGEFVHREIAGSDAGATAGHGALPQPQRSRGDDRGDPGLRLTMAGPGFEESAEELLEDAPCGYLSAAPDGMLLRVNRTFLRWTGYEREDLVGVKRFQDLLSVGGRIYHETHYAPMLRMQGIVREIAVDIVAADGRRLPVLVNSVLHRDAEGEPQGVRTTVFDATERKSYERELLGARNRERVAREGVERLQRITAQLVTAASAEAIAEAVDRRAARGVRRRERRDRRSTSPGTARSSTRASRERRGASARVPLGSRRLPVARARRAARLQRRTSARSWRPARRTRPSRSSARACTRRRATSPTRCSRACSPARLPRDPRFEIATLYHSAVEHLEVGGDWHDAFTLAGGRVGIVVGDVVGRGLRAASAMGQLRSAVRALAGAGLEPAAVMAHLDTFVEQVDDARYATLAYAQVDPDAGEVLLAAAGHMPPVIIEPDGATRLFMEGRSPPLGAAAPDIPRAQARVELSPGAGFLLYTDGLVERRTEAIDAGLERLLDVVRAAPDSSPARAGPGAAGSAARARQDRRRRLPAQLPPRRVAGRLGPAFSRAGGAGPCARRSRPPERRSSRRRGSARAARRSPPPRGSRGPRRSRTARVGADGLVLRAGEPEDLGAVQAAALADEAHEVRRVLAVLHALVDLAERRLVHRDPLFALAFHY